MKIKFMDTSMPTPEYKDNEQGVPIPVNENDHWYFYLDLEVIPRIGETLSVHKSLLPPCFIKGLFEDLSQIDIDDFNDIFDGFISAEVTAVAHVVNKESKSSIEIGIAFEEII